MENLEKIDFVRARIVIFQIENYFFENEEISISHYTDSWIWYFKSNSIDATLSILFSVTKTNHISGDSFGLFLESKKGCMNLKSYSVKNTLPLGNIHMHDSSKETFEEFVNNYFNELETALKTYLNDFITGKKWEETPINWGDNR